MIEEAFKTEVAQWADKLGVRPKEVHIRDMSRKWASCSTKGRVTFSTALLDKPAKFREQVIAHELLHMRYRNHGKLFKAVLKTHISKGHKLV